MSLQRNINVFQIVLFVISILVIGVITSLAFYGPEPIPTSTPVLIDIKAEPIKLFPGDSTKLEAQMDGRSVNSPNTCFWSAELGKIEGPACDKVVYNVPSKVGTNELMVISVAVSDGERNLIGTGRIELSIVEPPSSNFYYLYILDSSARMDEFFDADTKLKKATDTLMENMEKYRSGEIANIGLRLFGYTETNKDECQNTELTIPVGIGTTDQITEKLSGLKATGKSPLHKAILDGIKNLEPVPEKHYYLILITGGADGCEYSFDVAAMPRMAYLQQIYMIAIQPSNGDLEDLFGLRDKLREVIKNTQLVTVTTITEFADVLANTSQLSAADPLDQALGYDNLVQTLKNQGDNRGAELLLAQQMDQMGLVPDLRLSLIRRGLNSLQNRDQPLAYEDFTRVIKRWPDESGAYFFRGVTKYNQGDYMLAEQDFAHTIALNPDFAMAKYAQGFTLLKLDNPNFRDAFEEASKTDPTFFNKPYFADMTSAYTQFRFYSEATPLELERAGKEFFQGPIIFGFGEEQWQSFSGIH